MVTESVASSVYGVPRLTLDVDLVVVLLPNQMAALAEAFPPPEFYCPPVDLLEMEAARGPRGQFNIIHLRSNFKADLYLTARDPLNVWGFMNSRTVEIEGEALVLAPPEVVIVRKLEYFREGGSEMHIRDIRGMVELIPELEHNAGLAGFLAERGLEKLWNKVLEEMR
jgi:hypothetical protein